MSKEFQREKFKAQFKEFIKDNKDFIRGTFVTLEDLAKDPDFIADEDCSEFIVEKEKS